MPPDGAMKAPVGIAYTRGASAFGSRSQWAAQDEQKAYERTLMQTAQSIGWQAARGAET